MRPEPSAYITPSVALAASIAGFRKAASSCGFEPRSAHLTLGAVSWQGGGCVATGVGVGVGVGVTMGVGVVSGVVELLPPHAVSRMLDRQVRRAACVVERTILRPPCQSAAA